MSVQDASGNAITSSTHIANINPIRYRGYYFDEETELYYLQSRYYDPETGRYVNPDGYVYTGQDMQSGNMYAYQAHMVDAENRISILNCLLEYDEYHNTPWERTEDSLLLEWQMHHVFAVFDVSAQNVDFDNNEEGKNEIYYIQKAITRGWTKLFG